MTNKRKGRRMTGDKTSRGRDSMCCGWQVIFFKLLKKRETREFYEFTTNIYDIHGWCDCSVKIKIKLNRVII